MRCAVVGAGAWGTALSIVLGRKGRHQVRLWAYEKEVRDSVAANRTNTLFLPDHPIPDSVLVTGSLAEALQVDRGVLGLVTVTVTGAAPLIETQSSELGGNIDPRQLSLDGCFA